MLKSIRFISVLLLSLVISFIHGNTFQPRSSASIVQTTPQQVRRINPMKFFFTIVHNPDQTPAYSLEWNLSFLKTFLLESTFVNNEDKILFLTQFSHRANDYSDWSDDERYQLERLTEKYFNLYASPDSFLPFLDCQALTYAITDETLKVLQPNTNDEKRFRARMKAVQRLCNSE